MLLIAILSVLLLIVCLTYRALYAVEFAKPNGKHRGTYHHFHYASGGTMAGLVTPSQMEL